MVKRVIKKTTCTNNFPRVAVSSTRKIDVPVSVRCINCLCQAATGCHIKDVCRGELCGPFGLTKAQWLEVNSPTINRVSSLDPGAFRYCASNFYCAYHVIQRYMEKHQKDCNGDGNIDCDDYVAILKLGPEKCNGELPENYVERYDYCQAVVSE